MKKILLTIVAIALLMSLASCEMLIPLIGGGSTTTTEAVTTTKKTTQKTTTTRPTTTRPTTTRPTTTTSTRPSTTQTAPEHDPMDDIFIDLDVLGLNEMIIVSFVTCEDYSYSITYRKEGDSSATNLDEELMLADGNAMNCYILGISAGKYKVSIYANRGNECLGREVSVEVYPQDRSGFAHFGATEGVGAYNNDGTLKEGTKIIYVTNENKNTVTCEINGQTYTGLVEILQKQYNSSTPLLVRIIGKITTNQWNYKNVEPRLADNSNATDDFYENTFSTEYGENLANLIVKIKGNGTGSNTYQYTTTPTGLTAPRISGGSKAKIVSYKGSDFTLLKGKSVYDDDSYYNMLEVSGVKNVTLEGVGPDAEIFQFGIGFEKSNNIEVKNLTFTGYPEDALNFIGDDRTDLANYSRYWVHNCTFNRGYNAWDISGERDKYAGDGSIDFNNVSYLTLAYNYFNNPQKTMLFGNGDDYACMNMTMHHNYFYAVGSRLPLGRNVNIHAYNNYYDQCKNAADLRNSSYLFSENNYFNSVSKPFGVSSSYVKSFGDVFVSSSSGSATIVSERTKTLSGTCKPLSSNELINFDTNSDLFYYDPANKRTDVSIMLEAKDVPEFVKKYAGAGIFELLEIE